MGKKRALTPDEIAAAEHLSAAIAASGKSQEQIGADVGVTQGMIWQWANARLRVPAERAIALAQAVGIDDPGMISPQWADTIGDARVAVRPDGKVTVTISPKPPQPTNLAQSPDPARLSRAITEAAAAFRRARRLPTDEALAAGAVFFYQHLAVGQALIACRRALDDALRRAGNNELVFMEE